MNSKWSLFLLVCFSLIFSLSAQSKIFHIQTQENAQELWGDLIIKKTNAHPEMILRTTGKDIALSNVHTHWSSCQNGHYLVSTNNAGETLLLDVLSCEREVSDQNLGQDDQAYLNCPEVYAPVCGLDNQSNATQARSYSNLCEMNNDNAKFAFHGPCQ